MHRFYYPQADLASKAIQITDPDELHHIKDVLRLNTGSKICVFNGQGQEAMAVIDSIGENGVRARIESVRQKGKEGRPRVILACAVPKKAKFEFIIEKAVELGVDVIVPLRTKRTEVVFTADKQQAKQERFEKVILNAAKQCGRADIPRISPMISMLEAVKGLDPKALSLIPSLNGQNPHIQEVLNTHKKPASITFFIGPEGDFTPDEVHLAKEHGCIAVSLGPTVLKVDTAAIAVLALANFHYV